MHLTVSETTLAEALRNCTGHDTVQGTCGSCGLTQGQETYILRVVRSLRGQLASA